MSVLLVLLTSPAFAVEIAEVKALAEQGYAVAQYNLGIAYDTGNGVAKDHAEAAKWYYKAALQGHARAQNNLAACFGRGEGVPQNYALAHEWYSRAAAQGDALAKSNLASIGR